MHTLTRRRVLTAAPLITAALVLAGCSDPGGEPSRPPTPVVLPDDSASPGDTGPSTAPPPDATPTTEQPPPPTATSAPPQDTETTTAPPEAGRPEMPEIAAENSAAGAEAYAVYYLETVAWLATDPQEGILEEFRLADDCGMCQDFAAANAEQITNVSRMLEPAFAVGAPETIKTDQGASLLVPVVQPELDEVNMDGEVVGGQQAIEVRAGVDLTWTESGWRIDDVYRES